MKSTAGITYLKISAEENSTNSITSFTYY